MEERAQAPGCLGIVARAVALDITLNLNSYPFLNEFIGITATGTTTHFIITFYSR
jgi:hypothetical protein